MTIRIPTQNIIVVFVLGTLSFCWSLWGFLNGWEKSQFNFLICLLIWGFGFYALGVFLIFKRELKFYQRELLGATVLIITTPLIAYIVDFDALYYPFAVVFLVLGIYKLISGWRAFEKSKAQGT